MPAVDGFDTNEANPAVVAAAALFVFAYEAVRHRGPAALLDQRVQMARREWREARYRAFLNNGFRAIM